MLRTLEVAHPDQSEPALRLQVLVVWSPQKAKLDAQVRQRNLERLEDSLKGSLGKLNRRPYSRKKTVQKRLNSLLNYHPARHFLKISLEEGEEGLSLSWQRGGDTIEEAAELDGRYLLITNDWALDGEQMLELSKSRDIPREAVQHDEGAAEGASGVCAQAGEGVRAGVLHDGGATGLCFGGAGVGQIDYAPLGQGSLD